MRVPSNFSGDIMIPLTGIFRKNYNTTTGTFASCGLNRFLPLSIMIYPSNINEVYVGNSRWCGRRCTSRSVTTALTSRVLVAHDALHDARASCETFCKQGNSRPGFLVAFLPYHLALVFESPVFCLFWQFFELEGYR